MSGNVLLLGFTVPSSIGRLLPSLDDQPAIQTFKFGWSLARAIKSGVGSVFLASSVPIQNFPRGRKILFGGGRFVEGGIDGLMLGFVNVLGLKHFTRLLSCLIRLPLEISRRRIDWILLHGVHTPFLLFGVLARLAGIRLLVVLTDPAGVVLPTDGALTRMLKRCDASFIRWLVRRADGYICLSPAMIDSFRLSKPTICFPGILSSEFQKALAAGGTSLDEGSEGSTILYAGGLTSAYGVDALIDAVQSIDSPRVRLVLYGRGDQQERIADLASRDERFRYGGFVGEDELAPALMAADVLVNPRPVAKLFSVLSFPSKLIEYLATGRPVLTTRISSIPTTLAPYFNFIHEEGASGIRTALIGLLGAPEGAEEKAAKGRLAVMDELSEPMIGKKISALMQEIAATDR